MNGSDPAKTGVIIANTGSPSSPDPEAVGEYLREFLMDPRIRPMPAILWRMILDTRIIPRRSKASAEKYRAIWTEDGSPLVHRMSLLSEKVQDALPEAEVRYAMSYGDPSITEVIEDMRDSGCERIILIPLYPQSAFSTSQVVFDRAEDAISNGLTGMDVIEVDGYADEPAYLDAIAGSIREAGLSDGDKLLFAFHSIPTRDIGNGDTYADQVERSVRGISERLGLDDVDWELGYQSRFDKSRKWLGPSNYIALRRLLGMPDEGDDYAVVDTEGIEFDPLADGVGNGNDAGVLDLDDGIPSPLRRFAEGSSRIFVVCPNFSIDCLETHHDIGIELKERFIGMFGDDDSLRERMASRFAYVPCLNDSDDHAELIASIARRCMQG